jgi:ADP-heptose:LPS heptosyltransferase
MIIRSFENKKLVEYLKDGMKVCIKFYHGLGDTVMFYPYFEYLQNEFPKVEMVLWTAIGQEEYFGKVSCDEKDYDIVFELQFPCSEFNEGTKKYTKPEYCCITELGIDYSKVKEYSMQLKQLKSPLIAVHFQGTCNIGRTNPDYAFCKTIWDKIIENNYIPIELMFQHQYHDSRNCKFDFVNSTVRDCKPSVNNLIGLLQRCSGFVGVNSGPFHLAMNIFPEKILYIEKELPYDLYVHSRNVKSINCSKPFDDAIFDDWINSL